MFGETGRVVRAAAGDNHSAFVDEAGGLWLCGVDRWTQLGQDLLWTKGASWQRTPKAVPSLRGKASIVEAACGSDHTVALDSAGKVWAFGRGEHGQARVLSRLQSTARQLPDVSIYAAPLLALRM